MMVDVALRYTMNILMPQAFMMMIISFKLEVVTEPALSVTAQCQ